MVRYYIGQTQGRRDLLLIDNASCNGRRDTLPIFWNAEVKFLPTNTISRLQPCDAGVIASMKRRNHKRQMEIAVEKIDNGEKYKIYAIVLLTATKTIYETWNNYNAGLIRSC